MSHLPHLLATRVHEQPWLGWLQYFIFGEFLLILVPLVLFLRMRFGRWHDRWVDYRLLAEQLRLQRFLALLGRTTPSSRPHPHQSYGDPRSTWMSWHFRTIAREAGMVSGRFDAPYRAAYRAFLWQDLIVDQWRYHGRNRERMHRLNHHLHRLSMVVFLCGVAGSAAGCALVISGDKFEVADAIILLAAAALPALGSALYAITVQGEFDRLVNRSRAMSEQFQKFSQLLARNRNPSSAALAEVAEGTAKGMISEHLDWRLLFQDREWQL